MQTTPKSIVLALATLACLGLAARPAQAQYVTYTGEDLNAGPGNPRPNADAAAAAFDTAGATLGSRTLVTFESAPVGNISTLTIAPGVTVTGIDYQNNPQTIKNFTAYPSGPSLGGFNTTSGGTQYLDVVGGTATFTFTTPIQAFGAYLSGIQTYFYQDTFTFSDGTSRTINVPGTGTTNGNGALDFVGFTDPGKSISQITIMGSNSTGSTGADEFGVDDVRFVAVPSVAAPEPSQAVGLGLGVLGVACLAVRARKRRPAA